MPLPPKPKDEPQDLAEVERAISVLKGRHPEHERARREDDEARAKRAAELEREARASAGATWRKRLVVSAIVAGVLIAGGISGSIFRKELARRGRIEKVANPYRGMGFTLVEMSGYGSPGVLEVTPPAGCHVAVGTEPGPIRVLRPGGTIEGPAPVLFCNCEAEKMNLSSDVGEGGGLALLRADASLIGGSLAFPFAPFTPGTTARADEACADKSLDAWIEAKHAPKPTTNASWFSHPQRTALPTFGFEPLANFDGETPFAVTEVPAASCILAAASSAGDALVFRLRGGAPAMPAAKGAIGWCAKDAVTATIEREGDSEVAVVVVPAARVGGVLGLEEVARAAGSELVAVGVASADHSWNAKQLLLASSIPDAVITTAETPQIADAPEARIVALSFETPKALASESPDDVFSYCEPPLGDTTRHAVCAFSGPQKWHISSKDATAGLARAKLPFWLFGLRDVSDPVALQVQTHLVTLARRLKREGFEPTTLEAMSETESGVEVLGRSGEDAVVAIGLAPSAPWAFPYTDGPAWSLGGEPRIVAVAPLKKVSLAGRGLPPKAARRSVIFRRQTKKSPTP